MTRRAQVRIVVPTCSRAEPLLDCVMGISRSLAGFVSEIVVVEDSTGGSALPSFSTGLPSEVRKTGGLGSAAAARNLGARGFAGDFLVFVDSDVIVVPGALDRLLQPLLDGTADAVVGTYSTDVAGLNFAFAYKSLYIAHVYARDRPRIQNDYGTAIAAVRADVFFELGGFDVSYKGACGEDAEFGIRLTRRGYRIVAVPAACGRHRKRFTLRSLVINDWRKGRIAMFNYFRSAGSLTDNRHASRRDIIGSALATALATWVALATVGGMRPAIIGLPAVGLSLTYLAARLDLARCFATQGVGFLLRALPTMALLDVIRGLCVAYGIAQHQVGHLGRVSAMPLEVGRPLTPPDRP